MAHLEAMKELTFREYLDVREAREMRLIDVREEDEWRVVRATGAELHPLSRIRAGDLPSPDGREVAIICRSGRRSAFAAEILEAAGWPEMTNISDGTLGAIECGDDYLERG